MKHAPAAGLQAAPRFVLPAALLAFALLGPIASAAASPAYPLVRSANGRYLTDQAGAPFLVVGDAPQSLVVNLGEADAATFFADRSAHGFNTLWINLLCTTYTGGRADASTIDGLLPFTAKVPSTGSYDLTTPNEAYFAHVDRLLALAAQQGIQVMLDPIETGGFLGTMLDNGTARCRAYGRYLGSRYRAFDNVVWLSGNDFQAWQTPANDAVVRQVALGILDQDTRHLQTLELQYLESSSLDDTSWTSILGLNSTYTYFPTYARLRADYGRPGHLPNVMIEANYEFENLQGPVTTAPILRKQAYWTMTSGAAGLVYGNGYTWPFKSGWQSHLDTPGAIQMAILRAFFEPRAWYDLVPDTTHAVVTSGYGTYSRTGYVSANDYLTAARTPDGRLAVVYTPIVRTFGVDLSTLSAAAYTRWFDPSRGTYTEIAGSPFANTGVHSFTPPGNNGDGDGGWVLVLETAAPVTPPPPTDHLAAAYAFDETGGTSAADASGNGNVGVVHGATFAAGEHGNALNFDGLANYLETPNSPSLDIGGTGLTVSLWAKIVDTPGGPDQVLLGKPWFASAMATPYYQYGIEYSNVSGRTLNFYFGDPSGALHGPYRTTPVLGAWTHVAFTYDGATVKGYLDGALVLSTAATSSLAPRGNSLRLGVDGAHLQFIKGALDDVRIYGRALTPAEIVSTMLTPVTAGGTTGVGTEPPPTIARLTGAPNPFHAGTRIGFVLAAGMAVDVSVFDASGRFVRSLAASFLPAGRHELAWDGADTSGHAVPSGRYFVRLRAGERVTSIALVRLPR